MIDSIDFYSNSLISQVRGICAKYLEIIKITNSFMLEDTIFILTWKKIKQ